MTKWEYKFEGSNCLSVLNQLGADGWELVLFDPNVYQYLFKRPIPVKTLQEQFAEAKRALEKTPPTNTGYRVGLAFNSDQPIVVGFTGSREGMTDAQQRTVRQWVKRNGSIIREFHHGACVGSDAQAHRIVREHAAVVYIVAHLSNLSSEFQSAESKQDADKCHVPKPPLDRNGDIIAACDVLIATPKGDEEVRSGTWSTIRRARKAGKHMLIVYPDGSYMGEG